MPEATHRNIDPWPVLLAAATVIAFSPALMAGFLNYDDPWLIIDNPFLGRDAARLPFATFFRFDVDTRMALGAEYLPLRDLLVWLQTRAFGISAGPMHATSLALYVVSVLLVRGALVRTLGPGPRAELAGLLFAVHPVHVESVVWLASQKDVLALAFVSAALFVHAGETSRRRWLVPLLLACASLSKSMSVAALLLLAAHDFFRSRKLDPVLYGASAILVAVTMALHLHVGSVVHMVTEPLGGSRHAAVISMGPVWLRYLGLCLFPTQLSIEHDVPGLHTWSLPAVAGYAFVVAWLAVGLALARRGSRMGLLAWLWFFVPLAPVSQIVFPLENRVADRYLWLSVMAPCLLLAHALASPVVWRHPRFGRLAQGAAVAACLALVAFTFGRSVTFSDSVLLFDDGLRKTRTGLISPYQLGKAFEERGQDEYAIGAFEEVLRRAPRGKVRAAQRATNNLARLLARRGDLARAEQVLRAGLDRFPGDPKMQGNLVKVLRLQGREEEASALERQMPRSTPEPSAAP